MSTPVEINVNVTGEKEVQKMLHRAPEVYRKAILGWLLRERASFVGDKKKSGVFRKKLQRKRTLSGGGWSDKVINIFQGRLYNTDRISMTLRMGVMYTNRKKIHEILESFQERQTITSSHFMPIPVYKNLPGQKQPGKLFKRMIRSGELIGIYKKKKAFYFDKGNKQLLFVGRKIVRIKKQFDFNQAWNRRYSSVMKRYYKTIERATIKAQKGK